MTFYQSFQRRALRTASEKLRSRTSFSGVAHNSPGTRVNRYIGRLIEARQTESETADLNYITLTYRSRERERTVSITDLLKGLKGCWFFFLSETINVNLFTSTIHLFTYNYLSVVKMQLYLGTPHHLLIHAII